MLRDVVTCTIPRGGARRIEPAAFSCIRDQLLSRPPTSGPRVWCSLRLCAKRRRCSRYSARDCCAQVQTRRCTVAAALARARVARCTCFYIAHHVYGHTRGTCAEGGRAGNVVRHAARSVRGAHMRRCGASPGTTRCHTSLGCARVRRTSQRTAQITCRHRGLAHGPPPPPNPSTAT